MCQSLCWTLGNPEVSTQIPLHGGLLLSLLLWQFTPAWFLPLCPSSLGRDSMTSYALILLLFLQFLSSPNFLRGEKKKFPFWLFSISTSFCFITKSIAPSSLQAKLLPLSGFQAFKYTWCTFSLSHLYCHSPINPSFLSSSHPSTHPFIHPSSIHLLSRYYVPGTE